MAGPAFARTLPAGSPADSQASLSPKQPPPENRRLGRSDRQLQRVNDCWRLNAATPIPDCGLVNHA
jgi:hypothetical protein